MHVYGIDKEKRKKREREEDKVQSYLQMPNCLLTGPE